MNSSPWFDTDRGALQHAERNRFQPIAPRAPSSTHLNHTIMANQEQSATPLVTGPAAAALAGQDTVGTGGNGTGLSSTQQQQKRE